MIIETKFNIGDRVRHKALSNTVLTIAAIKVTEDSFYYKVDFYLVNEEVPIQKSANIVNVLCIKEGEGFKKGVKYQALLSFNKDLLAVFDPENKDKDLSCFYYKNVKYCKYSCSKVLDSEFILLED